MGHYHLLPKTLLFKRVKSQSELSQIPYKPTRSTTSTMTTPTATASIVTTTNVTPPDNIFVPVQADDILPQIPIGWKHPLPRKGIQDDEYRTLHTNKFYANAFLGEQNQPIWTHPYSIWWGKGGKEPGYLATWGMNVEHTELEDLTYGEKDPARVSCPKWSVGSLCLTEAELPQSQEAIYHAQCQRIQWRHNSNH
jgi:endoglucanase Acf2